MSESESKKLIRNILIIVVSSLIISFLGNGFLTYKLSSENSLINKYQDKEIEATNEDLHEFKDETKAQYYNLTEAIKELNKKL